MFQTINGGGGDRTGKRKLPAATSNSEENDFGDLNENNGDDCNLLDDKDYDTLANAAMHVVTQNILGQQNVLLIQPYIKWGPKKPKTKPEHQLAEAESLIRTLPNWKVEISLKVPVESMERKTIFGSGKLEELRDLIKQSGSKGKKITCVFISRSMLTYHQKAILEEHFNVPVMDRYSIVVQILRLHATSKEAKLQVALAEIPYIILQMRDIEMLGGAGLKQPRFYLSDQQKMMLKQREKKIQHELEELRLRRKMIRNNRKQKQFPVIAVVGYTNCGKTSLIKALTDEATLQPKDQLFATLDVTAHAGLLPCRLEVLFIDTVGFMSDIPTGLIECFVSTLEDALEADLIIHVQDVSHENWLDQKNHVETTLASLIRDNTNQTDHIMENVINVGNKIDLVPQDQQNFDNLRIISAKTFIGINDLLNEVEEKLLLATKRVKMTFRVPMGGEEMQWLYKNSAVTSSEADGEDSQKILLHVVISNPTLQQFKHRFVQSKK
ncbi:CLUMA_CG020219, isoform A [Clunio marinus]|uniref:CLUMA_CG020219, isoform A n=1 Tax=Clunio marinus TaxID=568069 RepID=A0A1J1J4C1_9DIPT|nr:CLUMA_CG020219, isoform A [Clunio marinus]